MKQVTLIVAAMLVLPCTPVAARRTQRVATIAVDVAQERCADSLAAQIMKIEGIRQVRWGKGLVYVTYDSRQTGRAALTAAVRSITQEAGR